MTRALREAFRLGAISLLCCSGCRTTLGEVETEVGQTTTAPLVLAAGTPVAFAVSARWVSFSEAKWLLLHADLMKGGAVVQTLDCKVYSLSRSGSTTSGCNSGGTMTTRECEVVIPAGGVDSVRVSTKPETGTATMRGMKVVVRTP